MTWSHLSSFYLIFMFLIFACLDFSDLPERQVKLYYSLSLSTKSKHEWVYEFPVAVSQRLIINEGWFRRKYALYTAAGLHNFIVTEKGGCLFVCCHGKMLFFFARLSSF